MGRNEKTSGEEVYGISVAAAKAGMGEQTLRLYERKGLLTPARTEGGTRRYGQVDLERLQLIATLLAEGLNLAGISKVIHLRAINAKLRRELAEARRNEAVKDDEHEETNLS